MTDHAGPPVKATTTSVRIVETLLEQDGATLSELTDHLDLSKSSLHNHLSTLEQLGFLVKDGWTYHVSLRFLQVGAAARNRFELFQTGRGEARQLANASGLTASLVAFERGQAVCIHVDTGSMTDDELVEVGDAFPLHCSAPGKAILAELDQDTVDDLLPADGLEQCTENTLSGADDLREEFRDIRSQGLAFDWEEWHSDVRGIASAITDVEGELLGALAVTGTTDSLSGKRFQQDVPGLLISSANRIRKTIRRS